MRTLWIGLVAAIAVGGCAATQNLLASGKTTPLQGSPDLPAAQGTLRTSTSKNGNTTIDVQVQHLALPNRVDPQATTYVVWIKGRGPDDRIQNLGALRVDRNLSGTLDAITPLRSFDLTITPEPSQTVTEPGGKVVLSASIGS